MTNVRFEAEPGEGAFGDIDAKYRGNVLELDKHGLSLVVRDSSLPSYTSHSGAASSGHSISATITVWAENKDFRVRHQIIEY